MISPELQELISKIDISTIEKITAFKKWQNWDGTLAGLQKLYADQQRTKIEDEVYCLVYDERMRQDAKWGIDRMMSNWSWMAVIVEEIGEVAEAMLKGELPNVRHELIHVAAVAVAWLEDIVAHGDERSDRDFIHG